ncbi:5-formyltetrahydrofolate cyclo-ligase [Nitratireductor pacificus]|uniref:5-formyltetrahydrofolate cyclo-ligase n=1 Tax=Nitratireductor pacificus pht-3B TaxID=391937 RepID=K2MFQ7_9HYPH|nr:5-formyltetrahydrofolate cyclo-ligase [Nitratireductor pacificus]EKF20991.1 5-formyltetrahydrofolate cyclo-ligase [Nitratireductor pacificus pht-3B]
MTSDPRDRVAPYASPPCFMHEGDDGGAANIESHWPEVRRFRKAQRERILAERLSIPAATRADMAGRIAAGLDAVIGDPHGRTIGLYWPFRGEPDLRPWLAATIDRGAGAALPVVVEKNAPLIFRAYRPGDALERGVWNIPVPAAGAEVLPDIVISPLVGFDGGNYRLGYGGGFYDRTLATLPRRPLVIGIGYAFSRLATIHPQPHDIPMDRIVTEEGPL